MAAQAIASNLSRPHPTDSRLLQNLIKSEKSYVEALSTSVQYAHGASSALSAWGTSEAPDIASASDALSEMLNAVADAQRTHVQAIDGYRSALKDVLDREQSIRSVVRDRDILVGRLIKASKKKPTKREIALGGGASAEEKSERVAEAQRELHACEAVLASEEAALVGVKRRTFKEALTMRMKTMGDAGAAMVDAARDAILLLDQVDTQGRMPAAPTLHEQFASEDLQEGTFSQQRQDPAHSTEEELREEAERKGLMPDGYGGYRAPWEELRLHAAEAPNRMSAQFENASVTPSQSASQVYKPMHARGLEQGYSSHAPGFGGIGEDEAAESDTSSEEDYRRAFVDAHVQVPVPAPHQIGEEAGSKDAFMPSVNYPTKNSSKHSSMRGVPATNGTSAPHAPPPPPPRKDTNPSVPMPAVPTAPRLDVNQVNMSGVPTAPKLYMPGQQNNDDSSSDEGPGPATVAHRNPSNRFSMSRGKPTATQSEASRPVRPNMHRRTKSGSSDDDPGKLKRNSSFFGKVGKLFKSDLRDAPMPSRAPPSGWQTRTDARLRESSPAKNKRASYRRNEPDSSDEEPDERELVRHVNNPKALWERNTASDVGSPGGGKLVQKPRTAVSRITAGPLSTKAKEAEEERQRVARLSVIGSGIGQGTPSAGNNAESQSVKKTKKSKKHGSEIGTAPTRTAADAFPTSVVVPGDASAGVRRTDSLKPGLQRSSTMRPTASGKKQRASMMSTSGSLNAFSPQESKYATANWVAKAPTGDADEVGRPAQQMTAADIARNAGVVPKPAGQPTSAQAASHVAAVAPPRGAPAGIQHSPSATKSPLLKPALKFPGVNTAGSISSIGSGSQASPSKRAAAPVPEPVLAPVPTALPPISASVLASAPAPTAAAAQATTSPVRVPATQSEQSKAAGPPKLPQQPEFEPISAPKSVLSFDEETPFDGTGALDLSLDSNTTEEAPVAAPRSPATAPRLSLQLTAQEPWNLSLGQLPPHQLKEGQSPTTPALMTPGAADAYTSFLNSTPEEQRQAEGVTRTTERTAKLTPSRRYGPPATIQELTDTSEEENSSVEQAKRANDASDDREIAAARQAVENQTQAAFADSASDAQLRDLRLGDAPATSLPAALSVPVGAGPDSESNSALSRRKSVRMAPDTKLPPETPTREEDSGGAPTPRADAHGGRDPMALSSRIAPPPPAPPRLPDKDKAGPTQLTGASALEGRSSGWSTRIGQGDDSSDEEVDDYSVARQAFGSASRSWGRATGQIKPKKKKDTDAASSTKSPRKNRNSGYNPAVALPAGMEVVGRSPSVKQKKKA